MTKAEGIDRLIAQAQGKQEREQAARMARATVKQKTTRIDGKDTFPEVIEKMADGNPGAMRVITDMLIGKGYCDIHHVLWMDSCGIYGPRIWMLYKDVCEQNHAIMAKVLDAAQQGDISVLMLNYAIDHDGKGLDMKLYETA